MSMATQRSKHAIVPALPLLVSLLLAVTAGCAADEVGDAVADHEALDLSGEQAVCGDADTSGPELRPSCEPPRPNPGDNSPCVKDCEKAYDAAKKRVWDAFHLQKRNCCITAGGTPNPGGLPSCVGPREREYRACFDRANAAWVRGMTEASDAYARCLNACDGGNRCTYNPLPGECQRSCSLPCRGIRGSTPST